MITCKMLDNIRQYESIKNNLLFFNHVHGDTSIPHYLNSLIGVYYDYKFETPDLTPLGLAEVVFSMCDGQSRDHLPCKDLILYLEERFEWQ